MPQNKEKPAVLVIGDLLLDYQYWVRAHPAPGGDEAILDAAQNPGGSAANTAVALRRQGVACAFCGRIGDDAMGRELSAQMQNLGIDLSCLHVGGNTGYTVTMIEPGGERTMLSYRGGDDYQPRLTPVMHAMIESVKMVFVSGYVLQEKAQAAFAIAAAKAAKAAGSLVVLDPSPIIKKIPADILDSFIACTDILLPNREELLMLAGCDDFAQALPAMAALVPCVVVKLGGGGSRLVANKGISVAGVVALPDTPVDCTVAAEKVTPVDTTGAGDSFNAGFIAAFLQGGSAESWLQNGNRQAAQVITRKGAVSRHL